MVAMSCDDWPRRRGTRKHRHTAPKEKYMLSPFESRVFVLGILFYFIYYFQCLSIINKTKNRKRKSDMNLFLFKPSQPLTSLLIIFALLPLITIAMSDSIDSDSSSSSAPAVHIIYTEKPQEEEPEAYHIRTLTAVFGRFVILSTSPVLILFRLSIYLILVMLQFFCEIDFSYKGVESKMIVMNSPKLGY